MARNKEALLLLLDVGPTMHKILPEIQKVCLLLIEKKLIYHKYDEVGVVLFGTEDTDNELTTEIGGYEHVVVLQNIKVVDGDILEVLQKLPRGSISGDFLDAIVVGMDLLIKKYGPTSKGKKRLCLITNAQCPINDPYEQTKEDQVSFIAGQMTECGMKMDSIVVREKVRGDEDAKIMDENDFLLHVFSEKTCAKTVHVDSAISLLGALGTRNITPVTVFRGDLEISSQMKIKVWVYKKTSEEKLPPLKRYSDKAPPTDKFATHEIKVDYEYKSVDDSTKVVPPEQRIKGYRYGPQVVPISPAEWEAAKFKAEKSVKILGFTDASNVMRHYYMRESYIFIAEPGNTDALCATSAIARAMKETNKVAILRCVWRQGQASVVVGVLTPNISDQTNIADSFYFNVLPFAEDIREFQFPSFGKFPSSFLPNDEQQVAADNFVKNLDLAPLGKTEILLPEFTPNPVLQRFYDCVELKSKNPDASVPLLDETLKKITEPDPDIFCQNESVIAEFCRHFEVKENPKLKKESKQRSKTQNLESGKFEVSYGVESVGNVTPVQDFEAMMSRRDDSNWVGKAIEGLQNRVLELVREFRNGRDNYKNALECLLALRKGCILEQEPKAFNDFLYRLWQENTDLTIFCSYLVSKDVTLITKTEAIDSEVTEEEAQSLSLKMSSIELNK